MIFNMGRETGNAEAVQYDNSDSGLTSDNVQDAIDEVSEAFQAGCDTIVSGITAYGVTPASNSPADIVSSVKGVYDKGVKDTKVGTASQAHVLTGKTFTNSSGVGLSGSMPNKGAVSGSISTSGGSYTIPAGYHNGSGKVTGPTLAALVGTNVTLENAANLLTGNTAYGKNGTKYTGSMANKTGTANYSVTPSLASSNVYMPIPANGYYNTSNKVYASYATMASKIGLTAAKLVKGNTVLGIAGTAPAMSTTKVSTTISSTYATSISGSITVPSGVTSAVLILDSEHPNAAFESASLSFSSGGSGAVLLTSSTGMENLGAACAYKISCSASEKITATVKHASVGGGKSSLRMILIY